MQKIKIQKIYFEKQGLTSQKIILNNFQKKSNYLKTKEKLKKLYSKEYNIEHSN